MIKLKIAGNPVTKKNSQRILYDRRAGRPFIAQSEAYTVYEQAALWQLKVQYKELPIIKAVNTKCLYYMESKRRCDLTNLIASTHDILVKAGILVDDNFKIVVSVDGSRVLYDKANPRVEIIIEEVEDGEI